jgi:hypothetical protein
MSFSLPGLLLFEAWFRDKMIMNRHGNNSMGQDERRAAVSHPALQTHQHIQMLVNCCLLHVGKACDTLWGQHVAFLPFSKIPTRDSQTSGILSNQRCFYKSATICHRLYIGRFFKARVGNFFWKHFWSKWVEILTSWQHSINQNPDRMTWMDDLPACLPTYLATCTHSARALFAHYQSLPWG